MDHNIPQTKTEPKQMASITVGKKKSALSQAEVFAPFIQHEWKKMIQSDFYPQYLISKDIQ